ncbi:MAG TPA: glycosyltransferase [Burkholderiales bacterium]|nr:glycosyltransferase [Burkholderiales bacterium]
MRAGGVFIGEPDAESGIATLIEALEICPVARVEVIGELSGPRLEARLRRAAYVVMPALSCEGVPTAVVAAFAHGVPVIASRLAPLLELVEPGRNGFLFEAGSPRDLARRLAWAEAFPEKMRQMGECARADYQARFIANWSYPTLFGERRRSARI